MTFGERLRSERNKKCVSQSEVAKSLGLTQPTIAKYELGIKQPTNSVLIALADYYGVSTDYLLGRV